ncbi:transposase [Luteolibacter ambystomatis]|uniref:transposase n=1 Tax=Luteolibacter ambystomatis TaxID=2824561 RepID=UPI0036DB02EB
MERTHGALPHWSQEGAVHFVTFRLHDSIPAAALERWHRERAEWLAVRGEAPDRDGWFERLSPDHRREYSRRFGRAVEDEMDRGMGSCVLRQPEHARIVADALEHFHGERYVLGDYVIMPNHVHLLVMPGAEQRIGAILQSWKSFTARAINERAGRRGALWQRESFDHIVRNRRQLDRLAGYIAENPIKAKLPAGEYLHRPVEWEPM